MCCVLCELEALVRLSLLILTSSIAQIFTGDIPFEGIQDGQLVIARYKGASPIRDGAAYPILNTPSGLMEVLHSCWDSTPRARPEVGDVAKLLDPTHPGSEPSAVSKKL